MAHIMKFICFFIAVISFHFSEAQNNLYAITSAKSKQAVTTSNGTQFQLQPDTSKLVEAESLTDNNIISPVWENTQYKQAKVIFDLYFDVSAMNLSKKEDGTVSITAFTHNPLGQIANETEISYKIDSNFILDIITDMALDTLRNGHTIRSSNYMNVSICIYQYGECSEEHFWRCQKERIYPKNNIYTEHIVLPNDLELIIRDNCYIDDIRYNGLSIIKIRPYSFND